MPLARLCLLTDVAAMLPAGCWIAESLASEPAEIGGEAVLHITGDVHLPALHLDAPLAAGSAMLSWLQAHAGSAMEESGPGTPFLILIEGDLEIIGALTCSDTDGTTHLVVTGDARMQNAVVGGQLIAVGGRLKVHDLLWGHYNHGDLQVQAGMTARVAVFTDEYHVHINGPEQVAFLLDEVRGIPHLAEFSSEAVAAVFAPELLNPNETGADGICALLNRNAVVSAVRAGNIVTRSSDEIHASLLIAEDLCADNAISIDNILALLRTPVISHKQYTASGWFQQTDFALCRRHVDEEKDQRDDNIFITVWKTWDFYLGVEQVPVHTGLKDRLAALVLRRTLPTTPQLTLIYRDYIDGKPGEWKSLAADTAPLAWAACQRAWRGVLDYVRKAVGQHRARYPLHQRLMAELTAARVESLTTLPVFTDQCNDWWSSDKSGFWEGGIWVGARQPCMHNGEPWGRALKFGWQNGSDAPGDVEFNAHSSYQLDVDEARAGPPAVEFTYSQRQSDSRVTLPACAADHISRLLRFYSAVEFRLRTQHEAEQVQRAEALRIEAAVHLLATPPLEPGLPDAAIFPRELMALSDQWQADGRGYVAAVRAHARNSGKTTGKLAKSSSDSKEFNEENQDKSIKDTAGIDSKVAALPEDPRSAASPTVLQLARVVSAWADEELSQRFRQRFAFATDAYAARAGAVGTPIGPVFALDDGRVIARVGPVYEDTAQWVVLHGPRYLPLPALKGLGRSPDRRCFAQSDGHQITTHQGFDGPVIARFRLPCGNEGLPANLHAVTTPEAQQCDALIPFNSGQRVLLANPTGVYLLQAQGVPGDEGNIQRIHPQEFDEDGPYIPSDQEQATALSLSMLHTALSSDERYIAVGDQDSVHILLNAEGKVLRRYEPLSSYPHHATFSHDNSKLFANSCHLYGGCTLAAPLNDALLDPTPGPEDETREAPAINTQWRVYASATLPGTLVVGHAHGYLHAVDDTGQTLWRHHIGSTLSGMDISPDGNVLWAASYGGYLVRLERSEAGMDPYSIGTSPYVETSRWIFWSDEAGPLRW